jgi:hypothetical protein
MDITKELKENGQDFEFYPTTKEMLIPIYEDMRKYRIDSVLDIGCGSCNFKKYLYEIHNEKRKDEYDRFNFKYFVIEKSEILIKMLDADAIFLGSDFLEATLLDKKVDVIFCNPPYSQFLEWTRRIINESNAKYVYLIIPERWQENKEILKCLKENNASFEILCNTDFFEAERQSRAIVDVVSLYFKDRGYQEINMDYFKKWFDDTFPMPDYDERPDYIIEREEFENKIILSKNKIEMLINLYNDEIQKFNNAFKTISSMDSKILKLLNVNKDKNQTILLETSKNLKILYWDRLFETLDAITSRLTHNSRKILFHNYSHSKLVDFNYENIYATVFWIVKNANIYYNQQLIDFFYELSEPTNVIKYKSNQRVFQRDDWRFNKEKITHFILDYRIIVNYLYYDGSSFIRSGFTGCQKILDIFTIANNLGFNTPKKFSFFDDSYNEIKPGEKYIVNYHIPNQYKPEILFDFTAYKNGNVHFRFNIEFMKAINVEVSRLLGWIKEPSEIKNEFPEELAKNAEIYFKSNKTICLDNDSIKRLTA